ncbi:MAG: CoA transferase [SAR86 cluster bacterium]|uniref:CoA transferase n=1 Tax=SAR86 cluster bacterium TaxID=2030880 RepID=A0A2A4MU13_9GAMM|nr:MAG: CoA transferase [SAR86 cluster bacterium]
MTNTTPSLERPLTGITVLSLEHAIAAPLCTRQLADLGARVIKIERPGVGDFARGYDKRAKGQSSHFIWTNRSKESLSLNIKHPQAMLLLHKLLATADVLVQNLAPGSTAKLGLSYESLQAQYPKLIVCDISGYGTEGSYKDKKAYDLMIQSEAGFLSVTGSPQEMAKAGISIADIAAGMQAHSGILAALLLRANTQQGSHITISMLESMVEWMGFPLYYALDGAPPPPRSGSDHASIYPYGAFPSGDGKMHMLGLQNEREWQSFCEQVLQKVELITDERFCSNTLRNEHREPLREIINTVFSHLTSKQLQLRLHKAQIANAQINQMQDVWNHPQLQSNLHTVQTPNGTLPTFLPPAKNNSYSPMVEPVPALGEHTRSILKQLDYKEEEIEDMFNEGVV